MAGNGDWAFLAELVNLEGSSGEGGPLHGRGGVVCVTQNEPLSPEVLAAGKHISWVFGAMKHFPRS